MDLVTLSATQSDAGKRLDQFLHEHLPAYSRARLQDWIKQGRVRVNGAERRASYVLRESDAVEAEPAELTPLRAEAEEIPLRILYEDADLVAVDKPAGMVVHAGAGVHSGTLVNALLHHFASLSKIGGELRPGIVHRLDQYTSGVLLVAKTDQAHRALAAQFAGREVEKVYIALVHGAVRSEEGLIEKPIARDPVRRVRMTARLEHGRAASTRYRVLRRWPGVHAARSAHRNGPHASDSRAYGQHWATRWWAIVSTARRHRSKACRRSSATSCMRTASASICRRAGEAIALESPLRAGIGGVDGQVIIEIMIFRTLAAAGALLALGIAADTRAQKPDAAEAPDERTRILVDVTRVNMLFTVTDKKGRFITDLTKEDFEVIENKKQQVIQEFTAESDLPLRLADPNRYQQQHPGAVQV